MQVGIRTVRQRRLYEDIVQQFHSLIRQGELQHGARLPSERTLAEQFSVSRSSVREAIRSLELQGLVVSRRGSGTFINTEAIESVVAVLASTLSTGSETLKEIFEVRHLLEPQISAVAATRADQDEMRRMAEILEEQRQQLEQGETGVDADTAFHFALASATHNSALVKVVSAVEGILQLSRDRSLQEPGRAKRSLESHRQILEKVRSGDSEGARKAMEYHLTSVEPAVTTGNQQSAISIQPRGKPPNGVILSIK